MTDPRLIHLIEQWRERARGQGAIYASGIEECADELDALLAAGIATPPAESLDRDAIAFLELLLSECGPGTSDHAWRKCKRCLAFSELEGHMPLARRFVARALERLKNQIEGPVAAPSSEPR